MYPLCLPTFYYCLIGLQLFRSICEGSEVSSAPKLVDLVDRINHPEGTNGTFTCSIGSGDLNGLTYEWKKDGATLAGSNGNKRVRIMTVPENFQSILRLTDLRPSDEGLYSCLARNNYGQDQINIRLHVKVQLKWLVEPRDVQVSAGQEVRVTCSADGAPKPTIEWRKVQAGNQTTLGPQLHFSSIRPEDGGFYECRAKNGLEKDLVSRRIEIKVLGK